MNTNLDLSPKDTHNPWLTPGTPEVAPDEPASDPAPPPPSGPTTPQNGVPAPPAARRLPRRSTTATPLLWWLGAHGGAGESTLAALLPGSLPCGHAWPHTNAAARVVLVARSNAGGLTAAQHAAVDWASGGAAHVDLLGLVIIADAPGKLPRPLAELARLVAGGVPRVWRLPWIEAWRVGEHPDPQSAPKPVARLLADIPALLPDPAAARVGGR